MPVGEEIRITDGKGQLYTTKITGIHKKKTTVAIISSIYQEHKKVQHTIAISLLKSAGRFEWFLEKATELGITTIVPLICERTEKHGFRYDRMQQICISAMLQSQQLYLPTVEEPVTFNEYLGRGFDTQKYIAHCQAQSDKQKLVQLQRTQPACFLIGPEGDFSSAEIDLAMEKKFIAVSLGSTRLRTETAGIVASVWLTIE
jgi:16S rRNA (uracil1498-N3)-methyltransferase